jgi:ABC-type glycerol-3-phosphate transport system substrate-binding protein
MLTKLLHWLSRPAVCRMVDDRLEAYLDGALSPSQSWAITAHLEECGRCQALARADSARLEQFRGLGGRPRVLSRHASVQIRHNVRRRLYWRYIMQQTQRSVQGFVVLGLLVVLAAGSYIWWQQQGEWQGAGGLQSASDEEVTITMAGYPVYQVAYENLARQFQERHANVTIQYVALDEQTARFGPADLATLADVLLLGGQPPPEGATAFLDLAPLAAADLTFDASDFWPGLLNACRAGDVQVGLPLQVSASLILFDRAAFDAAGLAYPAPGWGWEEFRQAADVLTVREGEVTRRYGFLDSGHSLLLLAPFIDGLIGRSGYNAEQMAAELEWYVALARRGVMPTHTGDRVADTTNRDVLIANRQAAMWVGSQSDLYAWRTIYGDGLGAAPYPGGGSLAGSNSATARCAFISAGTSHPEAAWLWLHFLSTRPPVMAELSPGAPARPSVAGSSGYWAQMGSATAAAIRYALERGFYVGPAMAEVRSVGEALNRALSGRATLTEALPATVESQPVVAPPPPATPVAVATPKTTAVPDEDILVVDYYVGGHPDAAAVGALARAFNESQEHIMVRLQTAFPNVQGGFGVLDMADYYDCFIWNGWAGAYTHNAAFTEKFYNLDPLMAAETAAFNQEFDEAHLEQNRIDGTLYALPVAVQPYVVQYNADLLVELGLAPPVPGWTPDEFWALAQAAAHINGGRQVYGFIPNNLRSDDLLLFVPGAEHFIDIDDNPPSPTFDDPAVARALTWLASMVENGALLPVDTNRSRTNWEYDRSRQQEQYSLIVQGRAAMWVHFVGSGAGGPRLPFNIGTAPFPQTHLDQVSGLGPVPTMAVISRRTADPAGCWEWLKFLSAQPDVFSGVPVRRSVQESPVWRAGVGEEAAVAYQIMAEWSRHSLQYWATHPYPLWWADALHDVFSGSDPAAVLQEIQAKAEFFYACYVRLEEPEFEEVKGCLLQADPEIQRE